MHNIFRAIFPSSPIRTLAFLAAAGLVLLLVLALPAPVQAAPVRPRDIPITQPDGSGFTARPWGDEFAHGMETLDGHAILLDEASRFWVYAVEQDGRLVPARSGGRLLVVGQAEPLAESLHARPAPSRDQPEYLDSAAPLQETGALLTQNQGTQPLLMIMVNFYDVKKTYSMSSFYAKSFGASSSIAHYYATASYGKLTIAPAQETSGTVNDGMVEITLNYYAPPDHHADNYSQQIADLALNAANPTVNFALFDANSDGYITTSELHIIFIIAGYEEAYCYGYCDYSNLHTWAHRWDLGYAPVSLDGKYVAGDDGIHTGGYAMFGEIHGYNDSSDHIAQIGIMIHELGHDLDWPDLYDTNGSADGIAWSGAGNWSVMAGGSWNTVSLDGDSPALPDAFLKWYQGWIQPANPLSGFLYSLQPNSTANAALLVGSDQAAVAWDFYGGSGSTEYWLVENRQRTGYDSGLPGCGILIWHINERASSDNDANASPVAPLVALEQADGTNGLLSVYNRGDAGDPYPGSSGNTTWGPATIPNSLYYSGASSGRGITIFYPTSGCATSMFVRYSGPETPPSMPNDLFLPVGGVGY